MSNFLKFSIRTTQYYPKKWVLIAILLFIPVIVFLKPAYGQKSMNWTSFKWGRDTVVFNGKKALIKRSAIFLPVTFLGDARRYYLQLDLSSTANILFYELPMSVDTSRINSKPLTSNSEIKLYNINCPIQGKLGISDFKSDSSSCVLMRFKNPPSSGYYLPWGKTIIGLIGLAFFKNRELMIDFPRQQFTLASKETILPLTYRDSSLYVHLKIANNRLSVSATLGDTNFSNFFYESGNSVYDVVVSKAIWMKLTGRKGDEKDNIRLSIDSWGNKTEAIGAPIRESLKIGRWQFAAPVLYFLPEYPNLRTAYSCDGFFGNSVFFGKTIIIDIPRGRLGIMNEM